jgi:hypothetical protein
VANAAFQAVTASLAIDRYIGAYYAAQRFAANCYAAEVERRGADDNNHDGDNSEITRRPLEPLTKSDYKSPPHTVPNSQTEEATEDIRMMRSRDTARYFFG